MRKFITCLVLLVAVCFSFADVYSQSLAGQTFSNSNLKFMGAKFDGVNEIISLKRDSILNAEEKKKGRKLTAKEIAKVDEGIEEGKKMVALMRKAVKMDITVKFISATNLEMKMDLKVDDNVLKSGGIGWLQRNALKAAFKMVPKSMKDKYIRKGNLVIVSPTDDPDTLRLSSDGLQLTGKMSDTSYTLLRK